MKQLKVITVIKRCSECPYANIFGSYCGKYKQKLPKLDNMGDKYIIPEWCQLDDLCEIETYAPELITCDFIGSHCIGVSCICADRSTSIATKTSVKFKCKNYNIWICRE